MPVDGCNDHNSFERKRDVRRRYAVNFQSTQRRRNMQYKIEARNRSAPRHWN